MTYNESSSASSTLCTLWIFDHPPFHINLASSFFARFFRCASAQRRSPQITVAHAPAINASIPSKPPCRMSRRCRRVIQLSADLAVTPLDSFSPNTKRGALQQGTLCLPSKPLSIDRCCSQQNSSARAMHPLRLAPCRSMRSTLIDTDDR